ncbi:chymotrypsin-like protease CTRL-1 isoform X2 [Gigantopelta aegis]|nr:chymotrypsin-like protease CTRL-1 isoform X2 [Gigantopelta aegis]
MTQYYQYCSVYILASQMYFQCGCNNIAPAPVTAAPTTAAPTVAPTTIAATTAATTAAATTAATTTAATTPAVRNCGISTINPASSAPAVRKALSMLRIVGGNTAKDGAWPWIVLLKVNSGGASFLCGGTIIDSTHVLTAAHCTDGAKPGDITVEVSEHDKTDPKDSESVSVSSINQHPGYTNSPTNDVSVLTLSTPLDLSLSDRGAICLADSTSPPLTPDMTCYAAGWGTMSSGGSTPDTLLQVALPAYEMSKCQSTFSTTFTQPDKQVCAGDPAGGVDTCQGDSGGPLFCAVGSNWVQYGV